MQTKGLSRGVVYLLIVCFLAGDRALGDTLCAYSKQSVVRVSVAAKGGYEEGEDEAPMRVNGELVEEGQAERCAHTAFCYALWQEDAANATAIVAQGCWSATEFDCTAGSCVSNKAPQSVHNTTTKFCCCSGPRCNANVSDGFVPPPPHAATATTVAGQVEQASYDTRIVVLAVSGMCSLALMVVLAVCIAWRLCPAARKPGPDAAHLIEAPMPPSSPTFNIESLKVAESIGRGRYGHVFRGTLYNRSVAVKIFAAQHRHNYLNERYIYCLPFMDHPCLPKLIGADERTNADDRLEFLLVLTYAPQGCLQEYLTHHTIDWHRFCRMAHTITQGLAHLHMEIRKDDKTKMCVVHRDLTSRNILIKADGSCMLCDFGFAICVSGSKYYINGEEQVAESTSLMDVGTLRYMAPEVLEGAVNLRDCESSLKQIDVYSLGLILWELATRCSDLFQGVEVPNYKAPFLAEIGNHPTTDQMQVLVAKNKARPLFPDIWKDTNPAVRALKETIEDCWDQDAEARLTALCVEERLIELPTLWDRHKAGTAIQGVSPTINPTSTVRSTAVVNGVPTGRFRGAPAFELPVITPNRHHPEEGGAGTAETKNLCAATTNAAVVRVRVPLQPHQGANPVLERNLAVETREEVAVSGNSLVEGGGGGKYGRRDGFAELFDALHNGEVSESNALVPNDVLSHQTRAANPIPYVQNAVHAVGTVPKRPNVPGNGHSLLPLEGHRTAGGGGGVMAGLRSLFKRGGAAQPVAAAVVAAPELPTVHVPKLNTVPRDVKDTEVCVGGDEFGMTQTVVRPVANRQVYCQTVPLETSDPDPDGKVPFQNGFVQSRTHPQLCPENNARTRRPNTLPIATGGARQLPSSRTVADGHQLPSSRTVVDGGSIKVPQSGTMQNGHAIKLPSSRTVADGRQLPSSGILADDGGFKLQQSGTMQNGRAIRLPSSNTAVDGIGVKLPESGLMQNGHGVKFPSSRTVVKDSSVKVPQSGMTQNGHAIKLPSSSAEVDDGGVKISQSGVTQTGHAIKLPSSRTAADRSDTKLPSSKTTMDGSTVKLPQSEMIQNIHAGKLPQSMTMQNGHAVKLPSSQTTVDDSGIKLPQTMQNGYAVKLPQSVTTQNGHAIKLPSSRMSNNSDVKTTQNGKLPQSGSESSLRSSGRDSPNRFSLYDDRIMTLDSRFFREIEQTPCRLGSPHISVSVPLSIDSLCESEVSNFHQTFQKQNSQPKIDDRQ